MMRLLLFSMLFSCLAFASGRPEKLRIQRGDSLSSISKTVFGDAGYWPKIWAGDSHLTNPHLLSPGSSIQFLLGSEESAPAFSISEADDEFPSEAPSALRPAYSKNGGADVEIPPPKILPKPILKLKGIFPEWEVIRPRKPGKKDYEVEILPRKKLVPISKQFVPVYVQDQRLRPIGEYVQTASDSGLVVEGEEVLVRIEQGNGQVGAHYLLMRDGGRLEDSGWNSSGSHHDGYVVEALAEIVLIANEPAESESGYDHFRGKVTHAMGVSAKGASIVPGQASWITASNSGSVSSVMAKVIGGNYDNHGMLFGEDNWVFLDKGAKDGLAEGQLLWVTNSPANRDEGSPFTVGIRNAALVKIAKVASEIATGYVVSSSQAIRQHDYSNGSMAATGGGATDDLTDELSNDEIGIDPGTSDSEGLGGDDTNFENL